MWIGRDKNKITKINKKGPFFITFVFNVTIQPHNHPNHWPSLIHSPQYINIYLDNIYIYIWILFHELLHCMVRFFVGP